MSIKSPKQTKTTLYIIGAGPGDPDLLTIKAHKILQTAEVILFDHLANKDLLNIADKKCKKIYVGKKPYGDYVPQEDIHALIKYYSGQFTHIVRLKGGDPYIFGRGFEELLYAEQNGIAVQYVPGISSMQCSGFQHIPLTYRGISEGIWMLTGTNKNRKLSLDLQLAIQSSATVIIYMGMKKLDEIAQTYIVHGKGDIPSAIIQHGTLPQQKQIHCKVAELPSTANQHNINHPAIIIIGEVVGIYQAAKIVKANTLPRGVHADCSQGQER
ncbi:uroporphyrinogen-III C-methyltransferase [Olivibacter sp. SDN3]|uniref:uroporphyrinogen-III C-methyltransferase n=1 Tax=Olivibacter sp. SDN3 TaxID=2764720 RepID=UPI001651AB68|nr:uroporphyrinogen-III C-methyltransferase [Olivibacter sp. SDN3]QNL49693.1 uroporphyrinogen-III C-methyltransferase [Olivibacter sp. SDN3]